MAHMCVSDRYTKALVVWQGPLRFRDSFFLHQAGGVLSALKKDP